MKYFKIIYGFNEADYLGITENELPKAIWLFKNGTNRAVFGSGAVRGQDIMRIVPDWHASQGWNKGWKMTPDDFSDIKHLDEPYKKTYAEANLIADYAVKTNNLDILNLPFEQALQLAPKPEVNEITDGTKMLADKMKMRDLLFRPRIK